MGFRLLLHRSCFAGHVDDSLVGPETASTGLRLGALDVCGRNANLARHGSVQILVRCLSFLLFRLDKCFESLPQCLLRIIMSCSLWLQIRDWRNSKFEGFFFPKKPDLLMFTVESPSNRRFLHVQFYDRFIIRFTSELSCFVWKVLLIEGECLTLVLRRKSYY